MANEFLFDRDWSLTFGPPGGEGKEFKELRTTFKVKKTGTRTLNTAEVTIYNLSKESRALADRRGGALLLKAGYKDPPMKLLFSGAIRLAKHEQDGPDWVTSFECADGIRAYTAVVVHESFGPDTTEKAVIDALAKKLGVDMGTIKGLSEAKYGKGRQLSGPARYYLDALCLRRRLRWTINDGVLQIIPFGSSTDEDAVLLKPDTGLIGSPERTESGIKVVSLLQGGINPGRRIKVEAKNIQGDFIAENVTHIGDSHGDDWYTEIEALRMA